MIKPHFLIVEGPDCVGKTTTVNLIEKICLEKKKEVIKLGVLDSTVFGRDTRIIFTKYDLGLDVSTVVKLLSIAHDQLMRDIASKVLAIGESNLSNYVFVIDRFMLSTFAYQGQSYDHDLIHKAFISSGALSKLFHLNPIYILLQASDEILNSRLANKTDKDIMELKDYEFHSNTRNYYNLVAPTKLSTVYNCRYSQVDTGISIEHTKAQLEILLSAILGNNNE